MKVHSVQNPLTQRVYVFAMSTAPFEICGDTHLTLHPVEMTTKSTFIESEKDDFLAVKTDSDGDQESDAGKEKKKRTAFSSLQVMELERRFQYQRYLPKTERRLLAMTLRLTDTQIKTWFQVGQARCF